MKTFSGSCNYAGKNVYYRESAIHTHPRLDPFTEYNHIWNTKHKRCKSSNLSRCQHYVPPCVVISHATMLHTVPSTSQILYFNVYKDSTQVKTKNKDYVDYNNFEN